MEATQLCTKISLHSTACSGMALAWPHFTSPSLPSLWKGTLSLWELVLKQDCFVPPKLCHADLNQTFILWVKRRILDCVLTQNAGIFSPEPFLLV